jgi:hypothetical protein
LSQSGQSAKELAERLSKWVDGVELAPSTNSYLGDLFNIIHDLNALAASQEQGQDALKSARADVHVARGKLSRMALNSSGIEHKKLLVVRDDLWMEIHRLDIALETMDSALADAHDAERDKKA